MGIPTITATRILKGQMQTPPTPESPLSMDAFPFVALSKVGSQCFYLCDLCTPSGKGRGRRKEKGREGKRKREGKRREERGRKEEEEKRREKKKRSEEKGREGKGREEKRRENMEWNGTE
uniref:alkaline phosphatase n=1 Tax=Micrurus paraensis TaxID=1970185 RepID=A0A2D4K273_9SAUR